jgi:predicted RNA binding protein YcfA (HicA-like mRNA interferase family)
MSFPARFARNSNWLPRETLDLERHLRDHGCLLAREGGNHAIWRNPVNYKVAPVPRHREVKEGTVRAVCRQLEIPKP